MKLSILIDDFISKAADLLLYTVVIYYDVESSEVTICADTLENSKKSVNQANTYNRQHLLAAIRSGDFEGAQMWCQCDGRSLAVGDYRYVNMASMETRDVGSDAVYKSILLHLTELSEKLVKFPDYSRIMVGCSTPGNELGVILYASDAT